MTANPLDLVGLIKALRNEETLTLESGRTYRGGTVSGQRNNFRVAGYGAIIDGGLKLENCGLATVENVKLVRGPVYGLMVVSCAGFVGRGLHAPDATRSGFLTANTSHVLFDGCVAERSKQQHGFYLSQSGDDLTIQNCAAIDCAFAGIQVNAVEDSRNPRNPPNRDSVSDGVHLLKNVIKGCQRRGRASAITLMGVHHGEVRDNQITDHYGRNIFALFDDGAGKPELFCADVEFSGNTHEFADPKTCEWVYNLAKGNRNIRIRRDQRWPRGVPDGKIVTGEFTWV